MTRTFRSDARRCGDLQANRRLEWLIANGLGGYASTSINQMLTRRYHGLLVAAGSSPAQRFMLLGKLDATAMVDGLTYELATNDFPEAVHPTGHRLLDSFELRPYPTWRWRAGDSVIEQTLCTVAGENTAFIRYRVVAGDRPVVLTLRPLCTSRDFHRLTRRADMPDPELKSDTESVTVRWSGLPTMHLSHNGEFRARSDWYYNFELANERDRGYDFSQDLFMPGPITATLRRGDPVGLVVCASTESRPWRGFESAFPAAAARDEDRLTGVSDADPLLGALLRATNDFIVQRGEYASVIAGYPWFEDWGRDTFISLTGLCLVPGRYDEAKKILRAFAASLDQGVIPNRFLAGGEPPQYNTADGTLWMVHAADRYLAYTGDWQFIEREFYPVLVKIIEAHERGTRHGIHQTHDGLLFAGEPGFALTWMDARVNDQAVTPRIGKTVELCALWYNALRIACSYAERLKDRDRAARWRATAELCHQTFNRRFWRNDACCLHDVVDVNGEPGTFDASVRPNQLLAISLTHPILEESRRQSVVAICERDLLTPMGLRTLSPSDSRYRGRYIGNMEQRDAAYHQGTVWPWLLGPFVTAYVRAYDSVDSARTRARQFLDGLVLHLDEAGIGGVSEVAEGDPPNRPDGCPWQAWSVAEPLRALCEDILGTHPKVPVAQARKAVSTSAT